MVDNLQNIGYHVVEMWGRRDFTLLTLVIQSHVQPQTWSQHLRKMRECNYIHVDQASRSVYEGLKSKVVHPQWQGQLWQICCHSDDQHSQCFKDSIQRLFINFCRLFDHKQASLFVPLMAEVTRY